MNLSIHSSNQSKYLTGSIHGFTNGLLTHEPQRHSVGATVASWRFGARHPRLYTTPKFECNNFAKRQCPIRMGHPAVCIDNLRVVEYNSRASGLNGNVAILVAFIVACGLWLVACAKKFPRLPHLIVVVRFSVASRDFFFHHSAKLFLPSKE